MPNTKKYISLDKLEHYDGLIKQYIDTAEADALAASKQYFEDEADRFDTAGSAAGVQAKLDAEVTRAKAREDEIAGLVATAQGEVDALELKVGTLPEGKTDVISYINEKTSGIATDAALGELQSTVAQLGSDVDAIEADYLKAADKTALQDAINAEASRADAAEKVNAAAIKAVSDDYLKAADKAELQGGIDTNKEAIAAIKEDVDAFFADADMTEQAKDTLKELQQYIAEDTTGAASMTASIKENADAITAVEGRLDTAESDIEAVEGRVGANETAIATLQGAVGEGGSVDEKISEAVAAETSARETAIAAVQADADKGIADAAAALTAANNASSHADALNTAMDTRVKVVEAKAHEHANKAELDLIASGDKAKWDGMQAAAEATAANALAGAVSTLEGKITAAQTAAENKATNYNTAMDTRVTSLEAWHTAFSEASEEEINSLFA